MELRDWTLLISTLSDLSDGVPLLFLFSAALSPALQWLRAYFIISLSIKLVTIILIFGFSVRNTLPFYHVLALVEATCLFLYYRYAVPLKRRDILFPLSLLIVFNLVNSLLFQQIDQFNSNAWGVNTFVLMFLALIYLYRLYEGADDVAVEKHGGFIINAGFLIYFSGSLFTYLLGWYILSREPEGFFANGWIIQASSNLLKNGMVAFGIYRQRF